MIDYERIIADLEAVQRLPQLYVQPVTANCLRAYLSGIEQGILLSRTELERSEFHEAARLAMLDRGWRTPTFSVPWK